MIRVVYATGSQEKDGEGPLVPESALKQLPRDGSVGSLSWGARIAEILMDVGRCKHYAHRSLILFLF